MAGNMMTLLSFMIGTFSFLVLCQVQNSNAYPTGAVTSACGDMTPNHGPSSQTSVSPYTISVSPAFYQPGEQMTVTIFSNTGSLALKGMLLQARRTGTNEIIGTWSLAGTTGFQTLACNGANSAVTHTNNDDKPAAFQLNWTPPDVNGDDIYVTATFVQTMQVFWVAERTSDIQDACNANGANLCGANGNCESLIGSGINCICEEGYTGILCTMGPCDSDPCVNGGTCTNSAGDTPFTCSCPFPFGGPTCQTVQDLCTGNLCENGAGCTQAPGANPPYTCQCLTGFSGVFCGTGNCIAINDGICNNGTCETIQGGGGAIRCNCFEGFTGTLCDQQSTTTTPCNPDPCQNGGVCATRGDTAYTCACPATYVGTNCDIPAPCNPSLCQNGGTCTVTGTESYSCACPPLYTGINCQTLADTTLPTITGCPGDITDTALPGENSLSVTWDEPQASDDSGIQSFTPNIPSGFSFPTGQTTLVVYTAEDNAGNIHRCGFSVTVNAASVDPCSSTPCESGGQCNAAQDFSSFTCQCVSPYTGTTCNQSPCDSNPCFNGGTCGVTATGYMCNCPPTHTGERCETDAPCGLGPCINGGTCTSIGSTFSCSCPDPFTGLNCEDIKQDCRTATAAACQNGGNCLMNQGTGVYQCVCPVNTMGEFCEMLTPDCTNSLPCQNGGTCALVQASYQCQCTSLFEGAQCGLDITDCRLQANSCVNGGTCQSQAGIYACVCPEFFQLPRCIVELTGCLRDPCQNGGTCAFNENGDPVCLCPGEYVGSQCETALTCDSSPCQNGGTCLESGTAGSDGFLCLCPTGYTGLSCETEKCTASPCRNGGTCIDETTGFICQCPGGYSGDRCDTPDSVRPCDNFPCGNGATCLAIGTGDGQSYLCICTPGSTPQPNCEVQACSLTPCENGGTCSGDANSYTCQCPAGYTGVNCENTDSASPCDSSPCGGNGATCLEEGDGQSYICFCPPGRSQPNCDVQACSSSPCQNDGTCSDDANGYTCQCPAGYTGVNCENNQACSSSPCQNGGTCSDDANGYTCQCPAGYTGMNCENNQACSLTPCENGGTCSDDANGYTCQCPAGYTGVNCENTACSSTTCQNDGTCSDDTNGYTCQCPAGFDGVNCENTVITTPASTTPTTSPTTPSTELNGTTPMTEPTTPTTSTTSESPTPNETTCLNGMNCVNGRCLNASCFCDIGYTGFYCEAEVDLCQDNPCMNNGECINTMGSYACNCKNGFTGLRCTLGDTNDTFTSDLLLPVWWIVIIAVIALLIVILLFIVACTCNLSSPKGDKEPLA